MDIFVCIYAITVIILSVHSGCENILYNENSGHCSEKFQLQDLNFELEDLI